MTTELSDDDKKKIVELIKLEHAGGAPPGYEIKEIGDGRWRWSATIGGQLRMSTHASKDEATAVAWLQAWKGTLGWLPPNYTLGGDPGGHVWVLQEEGKPPLRSFPKASREEAQVEAWVDFKAALLGVKRPPVVDASGSPHALMARFQAAAFELITVETQLRALKARRDVLVKEGARLVGAFNEALAKMDAAGAE